MGSIILHWPSAKIWIWLTQFCPGLICWQLWRTKLTKRSITIWVLSWSTLTWKIILISSSSSRKNTIWHKSQIANQELRLISYRNTSNTRGRDAGHSFHRETEDLFNSFTWSSEKKLNFQEVWILLLGILNLS